MEKKLTCASFFAGVGGIDLAFEKAGFKIVYANEIDKYAVQTYENNSSLVVDNRDINDVKASEIPDFDVMIAGFPCQAFSIAGHRQGFEDGKGRGILFFELVRIMKEKNPSIIFLENVKNLLTHDKGNTYQTIEEKLKDCGYKVVKEILNSCECANIPQNRERIYIIAFKDEKKAKKFIFPKEKALTKKLSKFIDFNSKVEDKYYYTENNCYFYQQLIDNVVDSDKVYQWRRIYIRENKKGVCPTLTANMGTGGHNVPIILTDYGYRKLTPKECFNLQGFPKKFKLPALSNTRLYKQAGNSVVVPMIYEIAKEINRVSRMEE